MENPKTNIGLLNSDINILTTLQDDLIHDIATDMGNADPFNLNLDEALTSDKFIILEDICNSLKLFDKNKWGNLTSYELFPGLLDSKNEMNTKMHVVGLNTIADVIKSYMDHSSFPRQHTKLQKINVIVQLFGSNDFIDDVAKGKLKTVLLKKLAMHIVEKHELLGLQAVYAKALHVTNTAKWKSKITVLMTGYIPIINGNMPLFSFPEYSNERECLEPCTLEYTHMLTNLRSLICRKGIENVKISAFVKVCEEHSEIVSHSIIIECIEKKNADHAL